jgi:hypothetical protein
MVHHDSGKGCADRHFGQHRHCAWSAEMRAIIDCALATYVVNALSREDESWLTKKRASETVPSLHHELSPSRSTPPSPSQR